MVLGGGGLVGSPDVDPAEGDSPVTPTRALSKLRKVDLFWMAASLGVRDQLGSQHGKPRVVAALAELLTAEEVVSWAKANGFTCFDSDRLTHDTGSSNDVLRGRPVIHYVGGQGWNYRK